VKDLIQQATAFADSGASFTGAEVRLWVGKLNDALEKLTAGDVALPEPSGSVFQSDKPRHYSDGEILDYGNRRAAAAVLAYRDRCALIAAPKNLRPCDCTNCDCGNSTNARMVAEWDEAAAISIAIKGTP
jgi:hypothetical protein